MNETLTEPPIPVDRQTIFFTDVTLRDGEQQAKRFNIMPIEDRIAVFDEIVNTGIRRIEIGHLGDVEVGEEKPDVSFARALVDHIHEKSAEGDERYDAVELQVLFGTQTELTNGIDALEDFDKDRVIVHVYDRLSPRLRELAAEPYSVEDSAQRVIQASGLLIDRGYTRFSISGEGTIDPNISAVDAADTFYLPIVQSLRERGIHQINVNLPNTFGASLVGEWTKDGLETFNQRIKTEHNVTTSIHIHDDHKSATEVALAALEVGFDTIEGTIIGMGERSGNVALIDIMQRLFESARSDVEMRERWETISQIGRMSVYESVWQQRTLDEDVIRNASEWYGAASRIAAIYGTENRLHKTSIGDPESYAAGSGPHAHANQEALKDPVGKPFWKNYGRIALIDAMLGGPVALELLAIDVDRYKENTEDRERADERPKKKLVHVFHHFTKR